jgi:hypothetical protein
MAALKKYKFLFKPVFFIFNLFFATWLVVQIEKVKPSDFGKYRHLFELPEKSSLKALQKQNLKKLCSDYKAGKLDSTQFEVQLEKIMSEKIN